MRAATPVAVATEVRGTVDSVDLTQNPPVLKIGGQSFTLDKIKQVVRPGLLNAAVLCGQLFRASPRLPRHA